MDSKKLADMFRFIDTIYHLRIVGGQEYFAGGFRVSGVPRWKTW
jgi:hypothetical protein